MSKKTILVVDHDEIYLDFVADTLTGQGYHVITAEHTNTAISAVARWNPDLIFLNLDTPRMTGCSFLQMYSRVAEPRAGIIVMTGTDETFERSVVRSISACLDKPFNAQDLLKAVENYFGKAHELGLTSLAFA